MTRAAAMPALRRLAPLAALLAVVLAVALLGALGPELLRRRVIFALVDLIAVVGLYVFVGNSGVLSFGSVAFMAIGAYVSALLTMPAAAKMMFLPALWLPLRSAAWPPLSGPLAGGVAAAVMAALLGWPLMGLSGISASIATFALLVIVNVVIGNWTAVTGGQQSLMGLPPSSSLGAVLTWAVIALILAFAYGESRSALLLRASREDAVAARASGVPIRRHRLLAFVLSGFLSGAAGALLGHLVGMLRADSYSIDLTFLVVAMLVVGGMHSLTGAVAGTFAIALVAELLRRVEAGVALPWLGTLQAPAGAGDAVLALLMLLVLLLRPAGLAGRR